MSLVERAHHSLAPKPLAVGHSWPLTVGHHYPQNREVIMKTFQVFDHVSAQRWVQSDRVKLLLLLKILVHM